MSRFDDYTDRLAGGSAELHWRAELLDPAGELVATTDTDPPGGVTRWGVRPAALELGGQQVSQRTMTLAIASQDRRLTAAKVGPLHPDSRHLVRISAGLRSGSGEVLWWPQASMLIDEATGRFDRGLSTWSVSLIDALAPVRSDLEDSFSWSAGATVSDVVGRLLDPVLPEGRWAVEGSTFILPPGSFAPGKSRLTLVTELLDSVGQELVTDPLGFVSTRSVPPSDDDPYAERWSYGPGAVPVSTAEATWSTRWRHAWKVEGGSPLTAGRAVTLIVFDTDPRSGGFWQPDQPYRVIGTSRLPFVDTVPQAAEAGYAKLRQQGPGGGLVTVSTVPNPAIREGDLVALSGFDDDGLSGTYRVIGWRLPVIPNELMQVRLRGVFEPAIGYRAPFDRGDGCVTSVSDGFNRADQNLENLEGSPGSDQWTERGFSWGVVGQRAIQRYNGGWSLAVHNTPMCSTNQRAEIDIAAIPAGRFLGPVVRSSGEFDGYAALVDAAGGISLEVWAAGARTAVIGSHASGGSLVGKAVAIQAIGSAITVEIDGTTVISRTDDRRSGSHVGMLALGGPQSAAPAVEEFTAATV